MQVERKYRKQINRNGWMVKIQQFVWGSKTPIFTGYCPFFWFTWFSLIAAPLVLVIFVLGLPIVAMVKLIAAMPVRPKKPSDEELLALYKWLQDNPGIEWVIIDRIQKWIDATPDWMNCILDAVARRDRKQAKRAERDARDKQKLQKVANNLHYLVRPVVILVGAFIAFQIGRGIIWLWARIYWPKFIEIASAVVVILTGIALMYGIITVIQKLWRNHRRKCPKCPNRIGFWRKIGTAFMGVAEFLCDTIEAIYTRECPLIEWGDESTPIQKR